MENRVIERSDNKLKTDCRPVDRTAQGVGPAFIMIERSTEGNQKIESIYDMYNQIKQCFLDLGETGRVLLDQFVPALRGTIETQRYVLTVQTRIRIKLEAAGMGVRHGKA